MERVWLLAVYEMAGAWDTHGLVGPAEERAGLGEHLRVRPAVVVAVDRQRGSGDWPPKLGRFPASASAPVIGRTFGREMRHDRQR